MRPMTRTAALSIAAATTLFPLGAPGADGRLLIQVTPDGEFRASDGRPTDVPTWRMNAANAQRVIAAHAQRKTPTVIDYEHQTLYKEQNGVPAVAAAWFERFEYRPGEGLFAWVELTARAVELIAAKEMRFFSPVFAYDDAGNVSDVMLGALTNTPGLDGMRDLAAAASARFTPALYEDPAMDKTLLAALRTLLALADTATDEDVIAAVTALKTEKDSADTKIAALAKQVGAAPDPAKFVPIDAFNQLQTQVAALSKQQRDQAVAALVKEAEGELDGKVRITAATQAWFTGFAEQDLDGARAWLKDAPVIAALNRQQTDGLTRPAAGNRDENGLTVEELAVCTATGIAPKAFAAAKA